MDSVERKAYVNNMGGASVSVVDLDSLKTVRSIRISSNPGHIHLAADRQHFYITDNVNKLFSKYAVADGSLQGQVRFDHNALLFGVDRREEVAVVLHWYHDQASVVRLSDMRLIHQFPVRRPIGVSFTDDRCLISTYGGGPGQVSVWGNGYSGIR
jgi:DNA-binding beta-propeller fold protein YncE